MQFIVIIFVTFFSILDRVLSWNASSNTDLYFHRRPMFDGYDTSSYEIVEVESLAQCALFCIRRGECVWFYINGQQCKLYGDIFWLENPVSNSEWKYYERNYNNIAVAKNVTQVSTHLNAPVHVAEKAVDGIIKDFTYGLECSTTSYDASPWLTVDMEDPYDVDFVTIFNRRDDLGERLHNVEVRLGSTPSDFPVLCRYYAGPAKDSQVVHIPCRPNSTGRYLRIQILPTVSVTDKILTICELEIHVK